MNISSAFKYFHHQSIFIVKVRGIMVSVSEGGRGAPFVTVQILTRMTDKYSAI